MDKIPFSVYDFFGYLAAGALVLAAVDHGFRHDVDVTKDPPVIQALGLVLAAYILGHMIAGVAAFVLERLLVGRLLGRPSVILTDAASTTRWRRLFPGYFSALPAATQTRIRERAGDDLHGEALFWHCWAHARQDPTSAPRLATFLNLYGFCRNIATAALLAALVLALAALTGQPVRAPLLWTLAAAVVAIAMTYRYLKFLRHYSVEVFVTFAESPA